MNASGRIVCFFRSKRGKKDTVLPPSPNSRVSKTTPPFPETDRGVVHSSSCNVFSNCVTSSVQRPALSGVSQSQLKKTAEEMFFVCRNKYPGCNPGDVNARIISNKQCSHYLFSFVYATIEKFISTIQ